MVLTALHTEALSGLCSEDQLELLDSIDQLRLQGINHYVSLPQIIVCGDQSSGKSSVLEAISGVHFPVKANLCTRFPTELVLRRTPQVSSSVTIVPHKLRTESERGPLTAFHEKLDGFDGLVQVIEDAKSAMGVSAYGKAFCNDLLRVEITGPDRPHLTIVDLPGLIHSETKNQTASDVELIQEVVQAYMTEPRSVILAVVSAKNDFANQVVLKLARWADPVGNRTLGVITKPDTLIPGSDSEALYISLARNQEVEFRLGWHVLKNMDSETGQWSLAQRDAQERQFFSEGAWKNLPQAIMGINELRNKLSKVLLRQIAAELPSLVQEIESKIVSCHHRLGKLGRPRSTADEQRLYLVQASQSFQALVIAATDGTYKGPFFEDFKSQKGYEQRVRAVIQNLNKEFATRITNCGHRYHIYLENEPVQELEEVKPITRNEFIAQIQTLIQRTRGRELPGTFNPMIIADLFIEQSQRWKSLADHHVQTTWDSAKKFIRLIAAHIADPSAAKYLYAQVFEPALEDILVSMKAKLREVLEPQRHKHPITYNHYFSDTLQKVRLERNKDHVAKTLTVHLGTSAGQDNVYISRNINMSQLMKDLILSNGHDMERFAAHEALDCMQVYYKVALKRFIDDVAIEVIEMKLMSALQDIFSPLSVFAMDTALVSLIAGESEESKVEREELQKQLSVLRAGSDTCKRFAGSWTLGHPTSTFLEEKDTLEKNDANSIRTPDIPRYLPVSIQDFSKVLYLSNEDELHMEQDAESNVPVTRCSSKKCKKRCRCKKNPPGTMVESYPIVEERYSTVEELAVEDPTPEPDDFWGRLAAT